MISSREIRSNLKRTTSQSGSGENLRGDLYAVRLDEQHGGIRVVEDIMLSEQYLTPEARTRHSKAAEKTWLEDSSSDDLRRARYV